MESERNAQMQGVQGNESGRRPGTEDIVTLNILDPEGNFHFNGLSA